ncbi:expressed unknown protein [Seminavis robusta]|uniref:Uncharacterized protein n=1 Tax=Seminavis robusta TaxID=568900 RepID=A0A9N8H5N1_9STRA|nr:expressed unknown protein [Seminavis robusta]|eukprot:Sro27_g018070.1 n/a (191) ;mRNA; r:25741-26313
MAQPSDYNSASSSSSSSVDGRPSGRLNHHQPAARQVPATRLPVLFLAGVLLQCYSLIQGPWMAFLLWGNSFQQDTTVMTSTTFDLWLLSILASFARSLMAMVLLVAFRQLMATPNPHNNNSTAKMVQDLCFHVQCRFFVSSIMCLLPRSIPPAVVDLAVLAASTLNQRVVRQYLHYPYTSLTTRQSGITR